MTTYSMHRTAIIQDSMDEHEDTQVNVLPPEFAEFTKGKTRTMTRSYYFKSSRVTLDLP